MRPRSAVRLKDSTCWPPEGIPGLTGDEVCLVLTKGYVSLIDAEDAIDMQQYLWCVMVHSHRVYAVRDSGGVYLHREILKPQKGEEVDHIDQHRLLRYKILDNRRANLRSVTRSQNHANRRKLRGCSSIYKGVSWVTRSKKWAAGIRAGGQRCFLGYFDLEIEAAQAYDAAHAHHFPGMIEGTNAHMMKHTPALIEKAAV